MYKYKLLKRILLMLLPLMLYCISACNKIAGLPLQNNPSYTATLKNTHINESVWQFIKDRGIEGDSIFYQMYQAIIYSGIDTNEYTKPNRTYLLYNNDAVNGTTTNSTTGVTGVSSSSFFGKYKVKDPVTGKLVNASSWTQYPKLQIKNHLLSLIVEGIYTFETLGNDFTYATSLMPFNYDTLNTQSQISFHIATTRAGSLTINGFTNSMAPSVTAPGFLVYTSGINTTNGVAHVMNRAVYYQKQQSVWDMILDRAIRGDSIYNLMYQAIRYSGIDTTEYTNNNRTFILYTNDAINRMVGGTASSDCYFGKYKVNGQAATSWSQYPPLQVKNHLLSLIVYGERTLSADTARFYETSLMPLNYDTLNPQSTVVFYSKTKTSMRFNDFTGSQYPTPNLRTPGLAVRTPGLLSLNGPVHVIDRVLFYQSK